MLIYVHILTTCTYMYPWIKEVSVEGEEEAKTSGMLRILHRNVVLNCGLEILIFTSIIYALY